jgi:predicted nucleotidyltransferase
MRPKRQSFLRHPLSTLLGTEASVRVLRELALHGNELTTTVLAKRTGITDQSVRNVVNSLLPAGVLTVYGQGRAASYRLDVEHPLGQSLLTLFRAEEERMEAVRRAVLGAAQQMAPPPLAVWVFGSVARREDRPDSDLDLLLVVEDDGTTERDAATFRNQLESLHREQQITVSVVPVSSRDIERLSDTEDPFWSELLRDAIPWHGKRPEALASSLRQRRGAAPPEKEAPRG